MSVIIDHKLTLDQWAMITIREWIRKIRELGIDKTGQLASSFEATVVTSAGGDIEKVIFAFEYYGQMVNWGVGKGVPVELRSALASSGLTSRKKKEWYMRFYHELAVLKNIYAEKYGEQFNGQVVTALSD